jgi:outer membrane scaffolding protein for murein synthesis (MipA/OmpV family)
MNGRSIEDLDEGEMTNVFANLSFASKQYMEKYFGKQYSSVPADK